MKTQKARSRRCRWYGTCIVCGQEGLQLTKSGKTFVQHRRGTRHKKALEEARAEVQRAVNEANGAK